MLYPLSYAGKAGAGRVELPSPESESGALTVMRSACNIVTEIPRARIFDPCYAGISGVKVRCTHHCAKRHQL